MNILLTIFLAFLKIGTFSFGGGYAILPQIQYEVVDVHFWITLSKFTDIIAISQITPGPISLNAATYIGFDLIFNTTSSIYFGIFGALLATFSVVIFPLVFMTNLTRLYSKNKDNELLRKVLKNIRPVIIGLVFAAGFGLFNDKNIIDIYSIFIVIISFILFTKYKLNPIVISFIFAIIGILVY